MGHHGNRHGGPSRSSLSGVGVPVRRASQPSGHWLDCHGNPCASPNTGYSSPAPAKSDNPDPANWKIIEAKEHGKYLVLKIKYPDCTNYEGNKILVFEGARLIDVVNQKKIDPHFFPTNSQFKSPIARFEPTDRGWKMAENFVKSLP